jgi:ApaG protein
MDILTTNGITITVETQYLPAQSNPRALQYIFGYFITIENGSPHTVQLLRRHWTIRDAGAGLREVEGDGVIGQQPILKPGESHSYASYCDLSSDVGKMSGTYLMTRCDDGSFFQVAIPEFKLTAPFKFN